MVPVGVADAIGLRWFSDRLPGSKSDERKITLTPFAYLDVDALRRRAFELPLPFSSQWRNQAVFAEQRTNHNGGKP